jgi:hypothetical protein
LPITPPLALISSIAISATSFSTVSLIAIVPDSECSTPTLMVSILQRLGKVFPAGLITAASDEGGNEIAFAGSPTLLSQASTGFEAAWAALPAVHQATLAVVSTRMQGALLKRSRLPAATKAGTPTP